MAENGNRRWTLWMAGTIFTIIFSIISFTIGGVKSNADDIVTASKESIARDDVIKDDISTIKVDVGELKKDVEYMRESQERIELEQTTFGSKLDRLLELNMRHD